MPCPRAPRPSPSTPRPRRLSGPTSALPPCARGAHALLVSLPHSTTHPHPWDWQRLAVTAGFDSWQSLPCFLDLSLLSLLFKWATASTTCKSARQRSSASSIDIQFLLGVNISVPCPYERPPSLLSRGLRESNPAPCDDDVFYLILQKQKIGAELHIYLEEGTYYKRLFRGPSTNDMKN
jgi:hypothetical protein